MSLASFFVEPDHVCGSDHPTQFKKLEGQHSGGYPSLSPPNANGVAKLN
jgi:hypothetical protein